MINQGVEIFVIRIKGTFPTTLKILCGTSLDVWETTNNTVSYTLSIDPTTILQVKYPAS